MSMDRRSFFKAGVALAGVGAVSLAEAGSASAAVSAGLRPGSRGAAVKTLQLRLASLGYWVGAADGVFGTQTTQAVLAAQKAAGVTRDGVVGPVTAAKLNSGVRPRARFGGAGRHIEIDKARQIVLFVENGNVKMTANTSTGGGYKYKDSSGRSYRAITPAGNFRVYSHGPNGWVESTLGLGKMWRPAYFNGGIALHGSPEIPAVPVSHGCCRVSVGFMNMLYTTGWVRNGVPVHVY